MVYLSAAVVLVGVLCALNLLLTVGVIRRLREHTERLDKVQRGFMPEASLPPGSRVPGFETTDTDDRPITSDDLAGAPYVLAFMSTGCSACHEQLPAFAEFAGRVEGGRERVVAVVEGEPGKASEYVERLASAARVITGHHAFELHTQLEINVLPTYLVVDGEGVVIANPASPQELDASALHPVPLSAPAGH